MYLCEDVQAHACVHMCMCVHAGECSCISVFCDCVHLCSSAHACVHVGILVHVHTCMFIDTRAMRQYSPEEKENKIGELIDLSLNQLFLPKP